MRQNSIDVRELTKVTGFKDNIQVFQGKVEQKFHDKGAITVECLQEIKQVLNMSYFVISSTEEVWMEAINAFNAGNYHRSMVLIFPTLEHSLRY